MRPGPGLRRSALSAAVGVGTAGLLAAVLVLGPWGSMLLLAVVFVLVWPAALVVRSVANETLYGPPAVVALFAACGVLSLPGLVRLLTWGATGLLFAVGAATVAVVVDLVSRRPWRRSRQVTEYADLPRLIQSAAGTSAGSTKQSPLSVEELCRVWRESAAAIHRTTDARDRETVAEVRRLCLDELERRNPDGFRRWLDAGAPADPGAFLLPKTD
jgi:hypothetical protein